jgi:hypothetical protein
MLGDFMICTATSGSGVLIGMEIILQLHRLIQQVQLQALIGCCVVAVGSTLRSTAVRLVASTTPRTAAAAVMACGSASPLSQFVVSDFQIELKKKKKNYTFVHRQQCA